MKAWIDLETTGLEASVNGIVQLAIIIGKDSFEAKIKPFKGCVFEEGATEVNGISKKDTNKFEDENKVARQLELFLMKHQVSREQFEFSGYNSRFDMDFFTAFCKRTKINYWSFFNYYDVDVFALVKILGLEGERFCEKKQKLVPSKKLADICKLFGIKLKAHDALEDIKATQKLYKKLVKRYLK